MSEDGYNLIVIIACLALVVGAGIYVTFVQQSGELERIKKAEEVAKMKQAEMESLLSQHASTKAEAEATLSKWRSRYKVIPDTLTSPEVIGYLNDLTQKGFKNFDVRLSDVEHRDGYSRYLLSATGRGYFSSLYRFVWQIENSRRFYSISDLGLDHIDLRTEDEETGTERLQVMVSFNMQIEAYFGGPEGASANEEAWRVAAIEEQPFDLPPDEGPPVPSEVLADQEPDMNPFFPVIMEQLPPNTHGLIEVEKAAFVSIVGGEAVFQDEQGYRKVGVGGAVYLGQITDISAAEGRVTARLNKGGIVDEVSVYLEGEERYRQAIGPSRLAPTDAEAHFE